MKVIYVSNLNWNADFNLSVVYFYIDVICKKLTNSPTTMFKQQTTLQIMESHFSKIWAKLMLDHVAGKCNCNVKSLLNNTPNASVKFIITYDNGCKMRGKYKYSTTHNSSNNICAKMTRKYRIVKYSINIYHIEFTCPSVMSHCDVTLHCSRSNNEMNFLETEKQLFVDGEITKMILVCIHEIQCDVFAENDIERHLADNFLLSRVLCYVACK